jgi:hypothetical protein
VVHLLPCRVLRAITSSNFHPPSFSPSAGACQRISIARAAGPFPSLCPTSETSSIVSSALLHPIFSRPLSIQRDSSIHTTFNTSLGARVSTRGIEFFGESALLITAKGHAHPNHRQYRQNGVQQPHVHVLQPERRRWRKRSVRSGFHHHASQRSPHLVYISTAAVPRVQHQ